MCLSLTFMLPKRRFWKVGQTFQKAFFEALFKGVSTLFGLHNVEKCFEKRFLKCLSDLPKSSFGRGNIVSQSDAVDSQDVDVSVELTR